MRSQTKYSQYVCKIFTYFCFIPDGGFGVENVFLFLWAGTLLDLDLADLETALSASSSPIPEIGAFIDYGNLFN